MKGIIWHLRGEFGSFRPYDTTSIIDTYLFPPKTTIIGMIGAACGWSEDELVEYYDKIKVGIKIEHFDGIFNDLVKIWKVSEATKQSKWLYILENKIYSFEELCKKLSAPILRQIFVVVKRYLYRPAFTIYIATPENEKLINKIGTALKDPMYPITLGDSDSLFYPKDLEYVEVVDIQNVKSNKFRCLLNAEVVYEQGKGIKLTDESNLTLYPRHTTMLVSFEPKRKNPKKRKIICFIGEIELKKEIDAHRFKEESIYLF